MRRPRAVVVDTNVLVAGLLTGDPASPTATTVDGMLAARFVFLLSDSLLAEYRRVLLRPAIRERHGLGQSEVDQLLTEIVRNGIVRETSIPSEHGSQAPDAADQHLWDLVTAEAGAALVTGDRALLKDPPRGVEVLEPREFATRLSG